MKIFKRVGCFLDGMGHDIRLFNAKPSLIIGGITLFFGIISWIVGGMGERLLLIYIFPRSALPLGFMYFMWALSFVFIGIIIGGVIFGCEKYRRKEAIKIAIFLAASFLFTIFIYPVFFRAMAPFMTFVIIFVSLLFCFLALMASVRIYSLWTLCIGVHMLWLIYNGYLSLCISLIN